MKIKQNFLVSFLEIINEYLAKIIKDNYLCIIKLIIYHRNEKKSIIIVSYTMFL